MLRSVFRAAGEVGAALALALTLAVALAACSPVVDVPSASGAADPACASVMLALPETVADLPARETSSQSTAAWGEPSQVIVRCGVPAPGPTTDPCVGVEGVDWVMKEGEGAWTLTTYGRSPAVEVLFDPDQVASSTVLVDLAAAVRRVPQDGKCLGPADLPGPQTG